MHIKEQLNKWGKQGVPFVFVIDFEQQMPKAWRVSDCPNSFQYNFNGFKSKPQFKTDKTPLKVRTTPPNKAQYTEKFAKAKTALGRGDTFLLNLTDKAKLESNKTLLDLFYQANSKYKVFFKDKFVCFSPETFISIAAGKINAYPMKGTVNALQFNAKEILHSDLKEAAEHATVVDLLRNDLSMVSKNVHLKKYRYYEVLQVHGAAIGQMSSWIQGDLPKDYTATIGDIIFKLLPAGSISGAPKAKTVALIGEIEKERRGYYTGVSGYFNGENLDSCVLIRFLQPDGTYRCGGGLTHNSHLEKEYQELINKTYVPIF